MQEIPHLFQGILILLFPPITRFVCSSHCPREVKTAGASQVRGKDLKKVKLFEHKVCSSVNVQMCMADSQALLSKYDSLNLDKLSPFVDKLPRYL